MDHYGPRASADQFDSVPMPVETSMLKLSLTHELAQAIHLQLAHVKNSFWGDCLRNHVLEGLAMRTTQSAVPGLPDAAYTQIPSEKGWFAQCTARKEAVLRGIAVDLDKSGEEIARVNLLIVPH